MSRLADLSDRAGAALAGLGVAIFVAAIGVWAQNASIVGVNYDDGIYVLLARALAEGKGYVLTYLGDLPGIKYPPLYPLSLVPYWLLSDSPEAAFGAMKLANGLTIGAAAGLMTFVLVELGILSAPLAAGVALLGFASGSMMLVTSGLLSEPLYLILLAVALWRADLVRDRCRFHCLLAIGLLAALVALTRMAGLALVAAAALGAWSRYRARGAIFVALGAAILLLPWAAFTLWGASQIPEPLVPRYGSYLQLYLQGVSGSVGQALSIAQINVGAILVTLGSLLVPQAGELARILLGGTLIALAALGSRQIFDRAPTTAIYPWIYLLLVAVWTFPPFRFVFILFPILLALGAVSVVTVAKRLERSLDEGDEKGVLRSGAARLALLAVVALLVANMAYRQSRALVNRVWDGAQLQKSAVGQEVISWLDANTPRDAVLAYEFEPMLALHTGRPSVPNNSEPLHVWYQSEPATVESLARLLDELEVNYLAVRRDVRAAVEPLDRLMGRHPGVLELVHITPRGALIFRIRTEVLSRADPSSSGKPPSNRVAGARSRIE